MSSGFEGPSSPPRRINAGFPGPAVFQKPFLRFFMFSVFVFQIVLRPSVRFHFSKTILQIVLSGCVAVIVFENVLRVFVRAVF